MKLACQEHLIPGASLPEKWKLVEALGYDGIELRGEANFALRDRHAELRAARRARAVFPSVCVISDRFIGDFDAEKRRDAIENIKVLLSIIAELGGYGAITPASYGMFSLRLPPFKPPRSAEDDRHVLAGHTDFKPALDALDAIGFDGYMALECHVTVELPVLLDQSARYLRSLA